MPRNKYSNQKHKSSAQMPFGRYRGWYLDELPDAYLAWLLSLDLRQPLLGYVQQEAERRASEAEQDHRPTDLTLADEIVTTGFHQLSKKYHPDLGGSHEKMIALNRAAEFLREQVRQLPAP